MNALEQRIFGDRKGALHDVRQTLSLRPGEPLVPEAHVGLASAAYEAFPEMLFAQNAQRLRLHRRRQPLHGGKQAGDGGAIQLPRLRHQVVQVGALQTRLNGHHLLFGSAGPGRGTR